MAKKGSFSKVYDKNGDYADVEAVRFDGTRTFQMQGDVTASQTWNGDPSAPLTLNASIGAKKVTTDKINDKAVQTGQIDDGAVGLPQIATNAMNGTVQDNDSKLATHAAVKTYVDAQISGQGTYLGKHTVAEINAMVTDNLHNGDRVMTSDSGTVNLGPGGVGFDVEAGEDLILYKSGSTVQWDSMDGNFKTKQTAVSDPAASGSALSFIDTVSQDENGEITATKKTVTVDSTYSSAGTNPVNGKAVAAAIGTLDVNDISGFGAGKTLATLTETDGKVAATFQDIEITKSQVSDFPTEMTPSSHTHGNITDDGKIGNTAGIGIVTGTGGTVTAKDFTQASPATGSGTTTEFISTVAQGSDGAISATKKAITPASTSEAGIVQLSSSTSSSSENMAATPKAVSDLAASLGADKADKVSNATAGNFAGLDSEGNLTDSGKKASDFKTKQTAVSDPTASGTGLTFIDSISQDENGEITPSKKTVQDGTTSQKGVVELEDSTSSTSTTKAATPNSVKSAYDLANTANTGLANKLDKTGDGKDVTVSFSEASTRENIGTGEMLSVMFGKIKKWFTDLGTAAFKNVPASGNAGNDEVVLGSDTRLSAGASAVQDVTVDGTSVVNSSKVAVVPNASTSAKGAVQLAGSIGATVDSENNKAATEKAVRDAINALDSNKTSTDGTNVQVKVTETDGKISAVNITADNTENRNNKVTAWSETTTDVHYPSEKLVKSSLDGKASSTHTHGNIANDGKIGSTANLVVVTGTSGAVTTADLTTASPTVPTSGTTTSLEFIDTVAQDSKGKISATKKAVPVDSTYSSTGTNPVNSKAIAAAIGGLDSNKTSTDGTNVQVKVTETDGKISAVNVTTDNTENKNNKVSSWQTTPDNTHYPSEKLVKDGLDAKANAKNFVVVRGAKGFMLTLTKEQNLFDGTFINILNGYGGLSYRNITFAIRKEGTNTPIVHRYNTDVSASNHPSGGRYSVYYGLDPSDDNKEILLIVPNSSVSGIAHLSVGDVNASWKVLYSTPSTTGLTQLTPTEHTNVFGANKGSASVPVYVNDRGEAIPCTDDFARDSEVVTNVKQVNESNALKLKFTKNGRDTTFLEFMNDSEAVAIWADAKTAAANAS